MAEPAITPTPTHLRGLPIDELERHVAEHGEPAYRFRQLVEWVYQKLETNIANMTNLPKSFRDWLAQNYVVTTADVAAMQSSPSDGTRKYLLAMADGLRVESVLMPYDNRTTLCVSSQVGCPLDCAFCETAKGKYQRNLTAGEIIDQICTLKAQAGPKATKVNVVFMGMGEPLLNLDNVIAAIRTLNDPRGLDLGARRINVSTSSFPDRIRDLADADIECSLAISLNAPNDEKRQRLMPKASRFTIAELLDAGHYFVKKTGRRATLEYVMLGGINTSADDAIELGDLVARTPFKLNLIPYNPGRNADFDRLTEKDLQRFIKQLLPKAPTVTVRRSKGLDIDAACGQLWTQSLANKKKPQKERTG